MISDPIEALIRNFQERGWESKPFDHVFNIALDHPETIQRLAFEVMAQIPKGGTFFHAALSFLPMADWPSVVQYALNVIERDRTNEAAESVIAYASLQCLEALHPHLRTIYRLAPNAGSCCREWPWRESGKADFVPLRDIIQDKSQKAEDRQQAWRCLLETRDIENLQFAVSQAPAIDLNFRLRELGLPQTLHVDHFLRLVGFECYEGRFRQLYKSHVLHLGFSPEYFLDRSWHSWFRRNHPTWTLTPRHRAVSGSISFGGQGEGECAVCGKTMHRLLRLDPVPPDLGVTDRAILDLETCLSCLGWEQPQLFYHHDHQGRAKNIGYEGPVKVPQFPMGPLRATQVLLIDAGPRWRWQDWGHSNSRENLHRLGGHPCWIQGADYPKCPTCHRRMQFLLQLDSDLPTMNSEEWFWGSGGICYCFWCDNCKVSGFL